MTLEILEQTSLPRIFLFLLTNKSANISLLKTEIKASQGAIYKALDLLNNATLIIDNKSKSPPFERIVRITEKGEQLARKLSYVFDETKEVVPIDKGIVAQLQRVVAAEGVDSWEELVDQAIHEKLLKLKEKHAPLFR